MNIWVQVLLSIYPILIGFLIEMYVMFQKCVEGCAPVHCKPGTFWRDEKTCVKKDDCTCLDDGKIIKVYCVLRSCLYCNFKENTYVFRIYKSKCCLEEMAFNKAATCGTDVYAVTVFMW